MHFSAQTLKAETAVEIVSTPSQGKAIRL